MPNIILSPYFREISEIFSENDYERLLSLGQIYWNKNEALPKEKLEEYLQDANYYIGTDHPLDKKMLDKAPHLKAIIDVAGGPPQTIDYHECFKRNIRILSCSPAFAYSVAEMTLAMLLSSCRGLTREHLAFVNNKEEWQMDSPFDFHLKNQTIGFIGFGAIAKEFLKMLQPFHCEILVYDPWLPKSIIEAQGCRAVDLETLLTQSRVSCMFAPPTDENKHMLNEKTLAFMPDQSLLLLISRAHLCDFDALNNMLQKGRIAAVIDVFPVEPFDADHPIRKAPNVIFSAHRAAAIRKGRQEIGNRVVDDIELMSKGLPPSRLLNVQPETVASLTAVKNRALEEGE